MPTIHNHNVWHERLSETEPEEKVVKMEDALRDERACEHGSLARYLTEWGPFLWEDLQRDKEYINQGGEVGKAARQ